MNKFHSSPRQKAPRLGSATSLRRLVKKVVMRALAFRLFRRARPMILMYHSIGINCAKFTVSPAEFDRQLAELAASGYEVVGLPEFLELLPYNRQRKVAAITFDDGFKDFITDALPILKRHSAKASVFVITGRLGGEFTTSDNAATLSLMDMQDLQQVRKAGITLYPHSATHIDLDDAVSERAQEEIRSSIDAMEQMLGHRPFIFSYPRGRFSEQTVRLLEAEGIRYAVTTEKGYVDRRPAPLRLPRVGISSTTSLTEFKVILSGNYSIFERLVQWNGAARNSS